MDAIANQVMDRLREVLGKEDDVAATIVDAVLAELMTPKGGNAEKLAEIFRSSGGGNLE